MTTRLRKKALVRQLESTADLLIQNTKEAEKARCQIKALVHEGLDYPDSKYFRFAESLLECENANEMKGVREFYTENGQGYKIFISLKL